ncbi:Protein FAM13A [Nymphon striatum]|nr:Protein FAM13A [Nymphon striatum]
MRKPVLTTTKNPLKASQLSEYSPESKLRRMKRFLSSPLTRRKSVCYKTFGTSLTDLFKKNPDSEVPAIVKRICKYLEENGLTQEGIFRVSGNVKTIEKLRHRFIEAGDANLEEESDVFSAACLLKSFLRELPDPVIPNLLSPHFIAAHEETKKNFKDNIRHLTRLVLLLPEEHYLLLKYMIKFLVKVCEQREHNKMTSLALGVVFGPNIFRVSSGLEGLKDQAITNDIVTLFIENHMSVFEEDTFKTLSSPEKKISLPPTFLEVNLKAKPAHFKSMDESSLCPITKANNDLGIQAEIPSQSRSLKRVVNQSIEEVVSQNLFMSSPSLEKGSPSKRFLRQLSFEDTENLYSAVSQNSNRLKRSKSHNEVASLNQNDSCASSVNDEIFSTVLKSYSSRPRPEEVPKTCTLDLKYQTDDHMNRGLAPEETLSYDSDEMHELKRRSERENQVGKFSSGRCRRKSWSNKKAQILDAPSNKSSSSIISETMEQNEENIPSSIPLDLSNLHVHGHGSEPIPSEQHACSSWKLSSVVSNSSNTDNVVPCPRTSHLKSTSLYEEYETPQQYLNERRDFISGPCDRPQNLRFHYQLDEQILF